MDPVFRMLYYSEQAQKNSAASHAMTVMSRQLERIPDMTIDEIAELCSTNPMAISRTVRKLGYQSFSEFRSATQELVSQYHYMNRSIPIDRVDPERPGESFLDYMEEMLQQLRSSDIFRQIDDVCQALHEARRIHYYGPPFSSVFTIMLLHDLIVDGKEVHHNVLSENILDDSKTVGEGSLLFVVPNELSTDKTVVRELIRLSERRDVPLVLNTDADDPLLPFTKGPNLCYPGNHTASSVMNNQYVINMLTMTYRSRYIDSNKANL